MNDTITILFATTTGNAEDSAASLAADLKSRGISCETENVASKKAESLRELSTAILVVSTWGEGEPPDDAIDFFEELQTLEAGSLSGLKFAVFALGDSSYDEFCGFGIKCDQLLETAGATRLLECEQCDLDQDDRIGPWTGKLFEQLDLKIAEAAELNIRR